MKIGNKWLFTCITEMYDNLLQKRLNTILPGRVNNYWEQLPCASINSERQQAVLEEQLQQLTVSISLS